MDQRDYRSFIHLASTLHFGRSARALHMSPSALTRAVQKMEEELGHPLLVRDRREVTLTAAGHRFRRFAQAQLAEWEMLQQELAVAEAAPEGELEIACTVTACYSILPRLVATSRQRYPKILLKLITQDAARSMQQLEAGEVDVAVVPTDGERPGLHQCPLTETALTFIGPAEPQALGGRLRKRAIDWGAVPWVVPQRGLDRARLDAWLRAKGAAPELLAEVRGNEAIIAMVALGVGVALVPELVLEASPMKQRVRRLAEPPPPGYTVSLCTTPKALRRRVVQAFWDIARSAG